MPSDRPDLHTAPEASMPAPGTPGADAAPPAGPKVSFFGLFRFATKLDWLLMFFGLVCAIIYGAALPYMTVLLGDSLTPFIRYEGQKAYFGGNSNNPLFDAVRKDAKSSILTAVLNFALFGLGTLFACYFLQSCWMIAGERQTRRLRQAFVSAVLHQDMAWFDVNKPGDVTTRLSSDTMLFQDGISDKVSRLFAYTSQFFAGFIVAFIKSWKLTLVIMATVPIFLIAGVVVGKVISTGTTASQTVYAKAGAVAQETFSNIRTVSAYGGQERALKKFASMLKGVVSVNEKKAWISGASFGVFFGLLYGLFALGFWYGSRLLADNEVQAGDVLNVLFAVTIGAFSIINIGPSVQAIASGMGAAVKLFAVVDAKPKITGGAKSPPATSASLKISLKNVSFKYPSRPDTVVLEDYSLEIEAGKTVALVGASGSGKSTIIQLLERFYEPQRGSITIDDIPIEELSLTWLRENISLVSQEPILFGGTIEENIRYGAAEGKEVTMEMIQSAAKMSNAHDFIIALPDGYKSLVGEKGSMLSGGQKQRIAIARALIKNPKILLLDEASSALDSHSEKIVQEALDRAAKGRTTIMIAHRLSTVRNAEKIIVMQSGKIVESGTHDSLIALAGTYAGLVKAQEIAGATEDTLANSEEYNSPLSANSSKKQSPDRITSNGALSSPVHSTPSLKRVSGSKDGDLDSNTDIPIMTEEEKKDAEEKALLKKRSVSILRVLKMQKPESAYIVVGIIMGLLNGILLPAFGTITGQLLKVFAKPKDKMLEESLIYALVFVGLMIGNFFTNTFQFGCFGIAAERFTRRIREGIFRALLRQEIGYFDRPENGTGALTGMLSEQADRINGLTGPNAANLVQLMSSMIASLVIAFYYSWQMTLVVIGCIPFLLIGTVFEAQILTGQNAKSRKAYASAGQTTCDAMQNIVTVKSFTLEKLFLAEFISKIRLPFKLGIRSALLGSLGFGYSQAVQFWIYGVAFYAGYHFVFNDYIEASDMFLSLFTIIFGSISFGQAATYGPNVQKAKVAAIYFFDLIDRVPSIDSACTDGLTPVDVAGKVNMKDGKFAYPQRESAPVLKGMTLEAMEGKMTALVGPSGCGKSTIIGLLLRFYALSEGNLSVDDIGVEKYRISYLREQIAIVAQEPALFSGTIRENIAYGVPDGKTVTDEAVIKAATMANIHSFIDGLPDKYETSITSSQLSGGQKQRISIARALIREPRILLLDEATSALDSESEKLVQAALEKAAEGRTSIVIAHRLSTIQNAHRIIVVKDGAVLEQGNHQELLAAKGLYATLAEKQSLS